LAPLSGLKALNNDSLAKQKRRWEIVGEAAVQNKQLERWKNATWLKNDFPLCLCAAHFPFSFISLFILQNATSLGLFLYR